MKRYKALKDCIDPFHVGLVKAGDTFEVEEPVLAKDAIIAAGMKEHGFIKEIPERPKTVWDLKTDDIFYVIEDGRVASGFWNNGVYTVNRDAGDVFLTKEEAEKELARRKAKVILERGTKGFKPDWGNLSQYKYEVSYDYERREFFVTGSLNTPSHNALWFGLWDDAEASIKAHEKEWLCYLNIEN